MCLRTHDTGWGVGTKDCSTPTRGFSNILVALTLFSLLLLLAEAFILQGEVLSKVPTYTTHHINYARGGGQSAGQEHSTLPA